MTAFRARIQKTYELVVADPAQAYATVRALARDSLLAPEDGRALAAAARDDLTAPAVAPLTRAWALLLRAGHPPTAYPVDAVIADIRTARDLFEPMGQLAARAWSFEIEGFALSRRCRDDDLVNAGLALAQALTLREQVATEAGIDIGTGTGDTSQPGRTAALAAFDLAEALLYLGWLRTGPAGPTATDDALTCFIRGITVAEGMLATAGGDGDAPDPDQHRFWPTWTLARHLEGRGRLLAGREQPDDWLQAETDYRRAMGLRQELLAAQPQSTLAGRELFTVTTRLADLLPRGSLEERAAALALYEDALRQAEGLLAAAPAWAPTSSEEARRYLSLALNGLADLLRGSGDPADLARAGDCYARALTLREGLLAANPDDAAAQRDVRYSYRKMAELAERSKDPAARDWWAKAHAAAVAMRQAGTLAADEQWLVAFLHRKQLTAGIKARWRRFIGRFRRRPAAS